MAAIGMMIGELEPRASSEDRLHQRSVEKARPC